MGEGNSFSLFVCPHGGGYPGQVQMWGGGIPARSRRRGTLARSRWGGGTPARSRWRGNLARSKQGNTPARDGVPPRIGHQMEYLIRGGRYASCVQAGGLSCVLCFLKVKFLIYLFFYLFLVINIQFFIFCMLILQVITKMADSFFCIIPVSRS